MKLPHTLLICACLVFAGINFSTAVTPTPAPQQQVERWEYVRVRVLTEKGASLKQNAMFVYGNGQVVPIKSLTDGWLNKLGSEGWEMVSFNHYYPNRSTSLGNLKNVDEIRRKVAELARKNPGTGLDSALGWSTTEGQSLADQISEKGYYIYIFKKLK